MPVPVSELSRTTYEPGRAPVQVAYTQLLGDDSLLGKYQATQGFPTTFVIGKTGQILKKVLGSPPGKFEGLQKAVEEALAKS